MRTQNRRPPGFYLYETNYVQQVEPTGHHPFGHDFPHQAEAAPTAEETELRRDVDLCPDCRSKVLRAMDRDKRIRK